MRLAHLYYFLFLSNYAVLEKHKLPQVCRNCLRIILFFSPHNTKDFDTTCFNIFKLCSAMCLWIDVIKQCMFSDIVPKGSGIVVCFGTLSGYLLNVPCHYNEFFWFVYFFVQHSNLWSRGCLNFKDKQGRWLKLEKYRNIDQLLKYHLIR